MIFWTTVCTSAVGLVRAACTELPGVNRTVVPYELQPRAGLLEARTCLAGVWNYVYASEYSVPTHPALCVGAGLAVGPAGWSWFPINTESASAADDVDCQPWNPSKKLKKLCDVICQFPFTLSSVLFFSMIPWPALHIIISISFAVRSKHYSCSAVVGFSTILKPVQ